MTDHYEPIVEEDGTVEAVKCTWCGNWAPLGVPIDHQDDCGPPKENK